MSREYRLGDERFRGRYPTRTNRPGDSECDKEVEEEKEGRGQHE